MDMKYVFKLQTTPFGIDYRVIFSDALPLTMKHPICAADPWRNPSSHASIATLSPPHLSCAIYIHIFLLSPNSPTTPPPSDGAKSASDSSLGLLVLD